MPGEAGANEVQRVTRVGADLVAVGLRGDTFGAWRGDGTSWRPAGRFGVTAGAIADALAVTTVGPRVVAATDTNGAYGLWLSADLGGTWRPVTLPVPAPPGADHALTVAGRGDTVLLAADDGTSGTVWTTKL
jgi:hypothetical protein